MPKNKYNNQATTYHQTNKHTKPLKQQKSPFQAGTLSRNHPKSLSQTRTENRSTHVPKTERCSSCFYYCYRATESHFASAYRRRIRRWPIPAQHKSFRQQVSKFNMEIGCCWEKCTRFLGQEFTRKCRR